MSNGKGSRQRGWSREEKARFDANYDRIFGKKRRKQKVKA